MNKEKICFLIVLFFILLMFLVGFSTKAAHWDTVLQKEELKKSFPEVYPGLEGLIVIDVFLFLIFIGAGFFSWKPNQIIMTVLMVGAFLFLFIRFILSMLFLAGDSNYCRKTIDFYNSLTPMQERKENVEFLKTLKGAWAWEIIECLFVYVLAAVIFIGIILKKAPVAEN